ncbi:590_t:CDS:2, partial [Dentiscutata heterogama]
KKKIEIDARNLLDYKDRIIYGDWLQVIEQLSNSVDKQFKIVDLKQLFECDFSTSTKASITASRIVLLDSTKAYFRCRLRGGCGIPKVTLEDSLTDWFHLQEKVNKLRNLELDLDFWFDSTFETIDEWSGWISSLLPYTKHMCEITNNIIVPENVPSGMVNVPFEFKLEGENLHFALNCSAGFLGARQDIINGEYIVSPVFGWYIVDQI